MANVLYFAAVCFLVGEVFSLHVPNATEKLSNTTAVIDYVYDENSTFDDEDQSNNKNGTLTITDYKYFDFPMIGYNLFVKKLIEALEVLRLFIKKDPVLLKITRKYLILNETDYGQINSNTYDDGLTESNIESPLKYRVTKKPLITGENNNDRSEDKIVKANRTKADPTEKLLFSGHNSTYTEEKQEQSIFSKVVFGKKNHTKDVSQEDSFLGDSSLTETEDVEPANENPTKNTPQERLFSKYLKSNTTKEVQVGGVDKTNGSLPKTYPTTGEALNNQTESIGEPTQNNSNGFFRSAFDSITYIFQALTSWF